MDDESTIFHTLRMSMIVGVMGRSGIWERLSQSFLDYCIR